MLGHQAAAASGQSIYSVPGITAPVNYPPLFYYVTAALPLSGDALLTGRLLDFMANLAACILTGLIAAQLGCRCRLAILAGLSAALMLVTLGQNYVGMDNPHLTASALSLGGLWLYLRVDRDPRWAAAVALLCTLSATVKYTALAVPLCIAVDACFFGRKKAVPILFAMAASFATTVALCYAIFGDDFARQLTLGRVYSLDQLTHPNQLLGAAAGLLTIATIALVRHRSGGRIVVFLLAFSLFMTLAAEGGEGTDVNLWFEPFFAVIIALAFAAESVLTGSRRSTGLKAAFAAALACVIVNFAYHYPAGLWPGAYRSDADTFRSEVELVRGHDGPMWCENAMLCHELGQPLTYDPFWIEQLIRTGRLERQPLTDLFASRKFQVVQVYAPWPPAKEEHHFPRDIAGVIDQNYREFARGSRSIFLFPIPHSP